MSNILVTPDQIQALATQVNTQGEALNGIVQQLTNAFHSSEGYWQGNARNTFTTAFDEWNTSWGKMHEALVQMQTMINDWTNRAVELDNSVTLG